jgi:hypothetical protein
MKFFQYLPAYELNRNPRIIVAFEMDFLRNLESFKLAIPKGEKFTMFPQKELVQDLINSIAGKKVYLPHKLNIRCRLLPHTKLLHGIKK